MKSWNDLHNGIFGQTILNALLDLESRGYRNVYPTPDCDHACPDGSEMEPILLTYSPPARMNSFQALLYSNADRHGIALIPVENERSVDRVPWLGRLIYHVHWMGYVVKGAEDEDDARTRIDEFIGTIEELKRNRSTKIVWTAHNILPHDSRYPDLDQQLRQRFINQCDAIHLLSEESEATLAERFTLDSAKTFVAPHPTYEGAYPNFVSRHQARLELGISPAAYTFLLFGSLQRYKGLNRLTRAFEAVQVSTRGRCRLVIAGVPSDPDLTRELKEWATLRDDVLLEPTRIASDQVQYFFRGCDMTVAPYQQVLNSGVVLLSLTFGTPVLTPEAGPLTEFEGKGVSSFDQDKPDGLARAMLAAATDPQGITVDTKALEPRSPMRVSEIFFERLLRTLSWERNRTK